MPATKVKKQSAATAAVPSVRFAANDVRLSPGQWLAAALLVVLACWLIPRAWRFAKPLHITEDYRLPYRLGNDYWSYERMCRQTCTGSATLLIGDSVLWGHYVGSEETLSHYLNQRDTQHRYANLAVDGIHPVALHGLVKHYGSAVRSRHVILNCNLLWLSSPRHDLTSDKEVPFNHPALVPQFGTRIPCYRAPLNDRLGIVASRYLGILSWADHLRITCYDGDDLATWTIAHPYEDPAGPWGLALPSPDEPPSPTPDTRPWDEKGIRPFTPNWVPLEKSLQWRFFRQTVELLRQRGNQVFVLINPLNEHMLTDGGLAEYERWKQQVADWLVQCGVPHFAPPLLPGRDYADLSHPLSVGYAQWAETLWNHESFQTFLGSP